ncbi:hypothetical protein TNCV_2078741 [Trichonephila clavipes]|nr:hypothetical protein TNCV_2078741 [Trichonephila clavipes]
MSPLPWPLDHHGHTFFGVEVPSEWDANSTAILVTGRWFEITKFVANTHPVAANCDVNKQSIHPIKFIAINHRT